MTKFIIPVLLLISCAPQLAINELPMYGNQPKPPELAELDRRFINDCKSQFPSLDSASRYLSKRGWDYMKIGNISTAIKRFNQSWLLDSTNYKGYWGMAIVTSVRDKNYIYAVDLMELAIKNGSEDCELWHDYGVAYLELFKRNPTHRSKDFALKGFNNCISLKCDSGRIAQSKKYIAALSK